MTLISSPYPISNMFSGFKSLIIYNNITDEQYFFRDNN